jgi:hypothetical protein
MEDWAMDTLQTNEQPGTGSKRMRLSNMSSASDFEQLDAVPGMRWRLAILEMVGDVLRTTRRHVADPGQWMWKEEARLRATGFLHLALADPAKGPALAKRSRDRKADLRSIAKLALCYRSVQAHRPGSPLDCEAVLQDMFLGLAAAYQPAIGSLDLQFSSHRMRIGASPCRALVLFMSCIVQGILGRAARRGGDAQAWLKLNRIDASTGLLLVQTSDPAAAIFASPEYGVASRLAGSLDGEFVCRQGIGDGSIVEMRFSTDQCPRNSLASVLGSQDDQHSAALDGLSTAETCLADTGYW